MVKHMGMMPDRIKFDNLNGTGMRGSGVNEDGLGACRPDGPKATSPACSRANGPIRSAMFNPNTRRVPSIPPGLVQGQRPGPIPAYGAAIGFWTTNDKSEGCKPDPSPRPHLCHDTGLSALHSFRCPIPMAMP